MVEKIIIKNIPNGVLVNTKDLDFEVVLSGGKRQGGKGFSIEEIAHFFGVSPEDVE